MLPPSLQTLLNTLSHHWSDELAPTYFATALTRRAWNEEAGIPDGKNHESMEWLGDRILGAIVAEYLWSHFPHSEPGQYDLARDSLTSETPLAEIARELNLLPSIRMGRGERSQGQVSNDKAQSDHVEALVAAAFLAGGWPGAKAFVLNLLASRLPEHLPKKGTRQQGETGSQAMTALNARVQERWRTNIPSSSWKVSRVGGTDSQPEHQATVHLPDASQHVGAAISGKKQKAKASAAEAALKYLDGL
ncbi:MAG: ribonuclease-3 [Myxococcota bacterium]|jgi:ribonuclease-3